MRIAIVDDIESERKMLRNRLQIQMNRLALHAEIFEYEQGKTFLDAAAQEPFTLVFLDIYLKNENGVDTAKALRSFDKSCILIFTTTSADHALEGFRVRALQYLVKPYTEAEISSLFDEIMERLPVQDSYIEVNAAGKTTRLRLSEILYAEHYQHYIYIRTADGGTIITRQTIREFAKSLNDERFFLCSQGLIVNLEYAESFDGTDFILKNGKRILVSRSQSKIARQAFGDFLFKRGRML